jgi:hypothetical protein
MLFAAPSRLYPGIVIQISLHLREALILTLLYPLSPPVRLGRNRGRPEPWRLIAPWATPLLHGIRPHSPQRLWAIHCRHSADEYSY